MGLKSTALILILVFGIMFAALAFVVPDSRSPEMTIPAISIVTIPENASLADSGRSFEPSPIWVVIGVNNTVRWINQDVFMSSVVADESGDPDFVNATKIRCENDDEQSCNVIPGENMLLPGGTFEYTFTNLGVFEYYSTPHPHMRGTVIVLPQQPILLAAGIDSRPNLTEDDAANITRADMEKKVAPMRVDKFVLYPRYHGHPLALAFVHTNGTQYYIHRGDTCTLPADKVCNIGDDIAEAIKGHLTYIVDGSWQDYSAKNCNHFIYAVDADSGAILWAYIDQEEIGSCPVKPPDW